MIWTEDSILQVTEIVDLENLKNIIKISILKGKWKTFNKKINFYMGHIEINFFGSNKNSQLRHMAMQYDRFFNSLLIKTKKF